MTRYGTLAWLLMGAVLSGCVSYGSGQYARLSAPQGEAQVQETKKVRVTLRPVDATKLPEDHPFFYRGRPETGFQVFEVAILNTGKETIDCNINPGFGFRGRQVITKETREAQSGERTREVVTEMKVSLHTSDGESYPLLNDMDFSQKYLAIWQEQFNKEMATRTAIGLIPFVGIFAALGSPTGSMQDMQDNIARAKRLVYKAERCRPGETMKGLLVFDSINPLPDEIRVVVPIEEDELVFNFRPVEDKQK